MIATVSKDIYRKLARRPGGRKALAFAIFIKNNNGASVVKDWTYRKLSRMTGLSPNTCKVRVDVLKEAGLVWTEQKNGHRYLHVAILHSAPSFHRWKNKNEKKYHTTIRRRKKDNLPLVGDGWGTIKDIEFALMGIGVNDELRRREYAKQLVSRAHNPSPFLSCRRTKRAKESCRKRGYNDSYTEVGFTYRRMMKWFHCGPGKIKDMLAFGESTEMFEVERRGFVHVFYAEGTLACQALPYIQQQYKQSLFATKHNIYYNSPIVIRPLGKHCSAY